jgi:nitrate reductase gamma subunit
MVKSELRSLSSPDDYISNILVTLFQLLSGLVLLVPEAIPGYFIMASLLLLYFPIGKLKHAIYFFAARYQLGLFYGWRGVWPPKTM